MFETNTGDNSLSVKDLHTAIQIQQYKEIIDQYNKIPPLEQKSHKKNLPHITAGYLIDSEGNLRYNQTILFAVPLPDLQKIESLKLDPYVLLMFTNHRRNGLMIFVRVDTPVDRYRQAHEQMKSYFQKKYELVINPLAPAEQEVIISNDPDSYLNESSQVFSVNQTNPPTIIETDNRDSSPYTDNAKGTDFQVNSATLPSPAEHRIKSVLEQLRQDTETVRLCKNGLIKPPKPILCRNNHQLIFPNTINVIQGKAGTHKSRIAADICGAFLKNQQFCFETGIGLRVESEAFPSYSVVYIDTERSIKYQFPQAMQQLLSGAELDPMTDPEELSYTSLINIPRKGRLNAVTAYLNDIRAKKKNHIIVILDVITDCISSFNDEKESLELLDYLNQLVNNLDMTIIGVIHENPGSSKARGHVGTELLNKASTVIQISRNGVAKETVIFKVDVLKNRSQSEHSPFYVKFDELIGTLTTANDTEISNSNNSQDKAHIEMICELLPDFLIEPKSRQQLNDFLTEKLNRGIRIIEDLVKEIVEGRIPIEIEDGHQIFLTKTSTRPVMYSLEKETGLDQV